MRKTAALLAVILLLAMAGCTSRHDPDAPPGGQVYHDASISITADKPVYLGDNCFIPLSITNDGDTPLLLCGSVGVRATDSEGNDCRCQSLFTACQQAKTDIPNYAPIDGLLAPGGSVTGFICVAKPDNDEGYYRISLATDYINDQWIEFDYVFPEDNN